MTDNHEDQGEMRPGDGRVIMFRLQRAEERIAAQELEIKKMREEAEKRERARLKWGIGALGTVLMAMASFMISHVDWRAIFK